MDLLAYCTSRSLNLVTGRDREHGRSDVIAEALGVDMADWWTPKAGNYLNHISKAKAIEAVREATAFDASKVMGTMKKAEAVAYAAAKLEGTRWLPLPLRT